VLKIVTLVIIVGFFFSFIFEQSVIFKSQIGGASKVNKILSETIEGEIPIFGSSRAQGNFVPSILDDNCFNYGIDGAQANVWLFFLEEELKKNKNTPILINFDLLGLIYGHGAIGNYTPNWNSTKDILVGKEELYYNIPFVRYYGQYESYLRDYINEKINLTKKTDNGGSFEKNTLVEAKFKELVKKRENTISSFDLNEELLFKFNKLINSTSRSIVLVISPYHKSYFNKYENIEKADEYLISLSKIKNIKIIDLRNYIVEDRMFMNTTHLNYDGALVFSRKLKELLTTGGIVNCRDTTYSSNTTSIKVVAI
jgi:hypothetical protein